MHVIFGFSDDLEGTLNDYLWGTLPVVDVAHDVTHRIAETTQVAEGGALFLIPSSMKAADIARALREGYDAGTAAILPLSEAVVRNASAGLSSLTGPEEPGHRARGTSPIG